MTEEEIDHLASRIAARLSSLLTAPPEAGTRSSSRFIGQLNPDGTPYEFVEPQIGIPPRKTLVHDAIRVEPISSLHPKPASLPWWKRLFVTGA